MRSIRGGHALALSLGALTAVVVACSSGSTPAETAATGPGQRPAASAPISATAAEAYRALVGRVNVVTLQGTTLLNQIALLIVANDDARTQFEDDVRLVRGSFELQRDVLHEAEPVPASFRETHDLLKVAMERYIEATSLLLPQSSGGPERFDFFVFQPLMEEGGKNFHGAGAALP